MTKTSHTEAGQTRAALNAPLPPDLGPDCSAIRGPLLHFLADPAIAGDAAYQYLADGLMVVQQGRIVALGEADALLPQLPENLTIEHYPDALILPGLIDTHVHMPQLGVIASYGAQLLDWLNTYTFPAETRFADEAWARQQAATFCDLLLAHGTTSGLVFSTSHPVAADALFEAAQTRGMALTSGKVMMDRHAPEALCDTADDSHRDSQQLIDRWHGCDRLRYAVTPRFAATSTPDQLALAGKLLSDNPGVLMQTHWAENQAEIAWTRELFPDRRDYLDVYQHYGLLSDRSVLAHGIHITDDDRQRLADTGTRIAFCPTSNTFLGSGLFDLASAREADVMVGLASDVGGGTSLSMLATLAEAYKVCQLRGQTLNPFQALYMATLGNAQVLHQDADTGNFEHGKYADFIVLDPAATPMLKLKREQPASLAETLFNLIILGDDRAVRRTYVAGQCRYDRDTTRGAVTDGRVPERMA